VTLAENLNGDSRAGELRVGPWTLDARNNELRRENETVHLEPKATEVLQLLASRAGTAVSREELLATVWPGVVVGDDALTQAIIKLRKALGDDSHAPKYIETISKRGYRLIAPVSAPAAPGASTESPAAGGSRRWAGLAIGARSRSSSSSPPPLPFLACRGPWDPRTQGHPSLARSRPSRCCPSTT
jgi:DNA-binding winged helix-turn-helix (wHTH) protein